MEEFVRVYNNYNYTFQRKIKPREKIICRIPKPTGDARRVKSISWSAQDDVEIKGTMVYEYGYLDTMWELFKNGGQVSPSITAISIENKSNTYKRAVAIWVVME